MAYLAKFLLWSLGLLGSCCAVSVPVALNSQGNSLYPISSGGDSDASLVSQDLGRYGPNNLEISFEDLFKTITEEGKKNQSPKNLELVDLPGKSEFQEIIGAKDINSKWKLISQKWKDCYSDIKGNISFCGYIELDSHTSMNTTYKLRIRYETKSDEGSKDSGQVDIIKRESSQNSITHYSLGERDTVYKGNNVNGVMFSNFVSWDRASIVADGGTALSGYSIKKEI